MTTTQAASSRSTFPPARRQLSGAENSVTILLGFWLMAGLFIDGWAHEHLDSTLETFFTPWHAVFYSGYAATAAWTGLLVWRGWRAGRRGLQAIPLGYELGALGVLVFGLGGIGDLLWHTIFGIERDVEALLSPTHLTLLIGMQLIVLSPFLAAWRSLGRVQDRPTLRQFLPALLSITASLSFVSFFHLYAWGVTMTFHRAEAAQYFAGLGSATGQIAQNFNLVTILFTTAALLTPVLLMLRRWRPPFGSVTLLFGLNTVLMSALNLEGSDRLNQLPLLAAPLGAGVLADVLIARLQAGEARPGALRLLAFLTPVALWSLHFLLTALFLGEGWSVNLWAGVTFMSGLLGLALSLLAVPPALPAQEREGVGTER